MLIDCKTIHTDLFDSGMTPSAQVYYKYRPFDNRAFELLLNQELWFASPDTLNDPVDCRLPLAEILQEAIDSTYDEATRKMLACLRDRMVTHKATNTLVPLHKAVSQFLANAGVLSLSKTAIEPLMWSHYGDGHKGLCIGFDARYFEKILADCKKNGIVGAQSVEYLPIPPFKEFFLSNARKLREAIENAKSKIAIEFESAYQFETIVSGLLTKYETWSYEEEYRVVKNCRGKLRFPPEAIKEIVFGARSKKSDLQTLRNILFSNDWNHIQFKQAKHVLGAFKMTLVDL